MSVEGYIYNVYRTGNWNESGTNQFDRTNQEHKNESGTRIKANCTKQEQLKKDLFKNNNL